MDPDDAQMAEFLDQNAGWVLQLATVLSATREDGEDLAQEALIRAAKHLRRVQGARSPRAYLRRIVVNESLRRPRQRVVLVETHVEPGGLDAGYAQLEARQETSRLLAGLTRRQAAAVALRYLEDCDYPEIAAALRCKEATARSLVKRGMDQLRREARAAQSVGSGG